MAKQNVLVRSKQKKADKLWNNHQLVEAKTLYQQICQSNKRNREAFLNLGMINAQLGAFQEAIQCWQHAHGLNANDPKTIFNLAKAHADLDLHEQAIDYYQKVLALQPDIPEVLNNLGNSLTAAGHYDDALNCLQRAVTLKPEFVEARLNLGNTLQYLDRFDDAIKCYYHAIKLNPSNAIAHQNLGSALLNVGRLDEGVDSLKLASQLAPDNLSIKLDIASAMEKSGDLDKACEMVLPLIDSGIRDPKLVYLFGKTCHQVNRCDEATSMMESILDNSGIPLNHQLKRNYHFKLGQLYEKKKAYDDAFKYFNSGNKLRNAHFDIDKFEAHINDIINIFSSDFFHRTEKATPGAIHPIFIIGMPRSGTSLVEQILDSHPAICGAGELKNLLEMARELPEYVHSELLFPLCVPDLSTEQLNNLAQQYLVHLREICNNAEFITDKMPHNFLRLGLIALLFPNAKIIHCKRNPLDTCLSCYINDFTTGHDYSYNLKNLGTYYRQYLRLMEHWHANIDLPIIDIQYEALIADQESKSRELVQFCGLEWDAQCLKFFENKRYVNTLSYDQVRKPIYTNSIERWRRYEPHLKELIDAIESH
ncbi:MAG: sulfotransferase [Gammaproteobacteria bacterium]